MIVMLHKTPATSQEIPCQWGNTALMVNTITVSNSQIPSEFTGFRIAQVSDLHNAEFGEENHCPFNLLWCDANAPRGRLNLHKTNAANEELVIRLSYGREVQGGFRYTDCPYHSNSLSNKMDNSLLAVRDTNHKSIVVGGFSEWSRAGKIF